MDPIELAAKIKQCSAKANSIAKNIINIGQTALKFECDPPVETHEMLQRGRSLVEDYCNHLEQISTYETAMAKFRREHNLAADSLNEDVQKYNAVLKSEREKLDNRAKPALLKDYDSIVDTYSRPKPELDDSEIVATECSNDYIDPITKKRIQRPVRNKVCNHIYEESSIQMLIKNNSRTRCPNVGCPNRNFIKLSDLEIDNELLTQLTQSKN